MTENTRQTKTQTHARTHTQSDTHTPEIGGTTVQTPGSVQLPLPDGGAVGQTERSVQLLLPSPASQIPVRAHNLTQPAKTTAAPACRTMLPAETAVPQATVADIAEIHAVTAIETAETSVKSAETKINEENYISHESQSIKQNIIMRNPTPPPFG